VSFKLKNTGDVTGADAVQVYVGPPSDAPAGVQFAVRSLAQFDRVEIDPGKSTDVNLHVDARQLSYWSDARPSSGCSTRTGGRCTSATPMQCPASRSRRR